MAAHLTGNNFRTVISVLLDLRNSLIKKKMCFTGRRSVSFFSSNLDYRKQSKNIYNKLVFLPYRFFSRILSDLQLYILIQLCGI